MSTGIQIAGADRSVPATRGELSLVQSDLTARIDIAFKNLQSGVTRQIWIAAGALTAVAVLLRFW